MPLQLQLSRQRHFKGVSDPVLSEIQSSAAMRHFRRGDWIFREGDAALQVGLLLTGHLKLLRHGANGTDVIVDLIGSNTLFGLNKNSVGTYSSSVQALCQGCLILLPSDRFEGWLSMEPELAKTVLNEMTCAQSRLFGRIEEIALGRVDARLASLLVRLANTEGTSSADGTRIDLPLSRRDLAEMINATVETTVRIISRWGRSGIVISEQGTFLIPEMDAVRSVARH